MRPGCGPPRSSSRRSSGGPVGGTSPSVRGVGRVLEGRPADRSTGRLRDAPPHQLPPCGRTAPVWARARGSVREAGGMSENDAASAAPDGSGPSGSDVPPGPTSTAPTGPSSTRVASTATGPTATASGRRRRPDRRPAGPAACAGPRARAASTTPQARCAARASGALALQRAHPGHPAAPGPREPPARPSATAAFGAGAVLPRDRAADPRGARRHLRRPGRRSRGHAGGPAATAAPGRARPRPGWLRLGRHGRRARHPARRLPPRPRRRLGRRRGPRGRRTDPAAAAARDPRAGRPGARRGPDRRRAVGRGDRRDRRARRAPRRAPRSTSRCPTTGPPTRRPGRSRRWRRTCCPAPCRSAARPARARGSCSRPTA